MCRPKAGDNVNINGGAATAAAAAAAGPSLANFLNLLPARAQPSNITASSAHVIADKAAATPGRAGRIMHLCNTPLSYSHAIFNPRAAS